MLRCKADPRTLHPASYPLSEIQKRLWQLHRLHPDDFSLHLFRALRIRGELEPSALHEALGDLLTRHAMLRARFQLEDGEPRQSLDACADLDAPLFDLGSLPKAEREAEALLLAAQTVQRPFDLARGPLLRSATIRLSANEHILVLAVHPIAADAGSLGVLLSDLGALYGASRSGDPSPPLPPPPGCPEPDGGLPSEGADRDLDFWRRQLEGAPALTLPGAASEAPPPSRGGARLGVAFPARLTRALRGLARRQGVSELSVLLAGFQGLLHRYTGETDIVVGAPFAHREGAIRADQVGPFESTLALRTDLDGDPRFAELLGRVERVWTRALAHRAVPLERVIAGSRRSAAHRIQLSLRDEPPGFAAPGLEAESLDLDAGTAGADLALRLRSDGRSLGGVLEFDAGLLDAATAGRLWGHLRTLLAAAAADPGLRLSALPLLTRREQRQLERWNGARVAFHSAGCLHQLFEEQTRRRPQQVAAIFGERRLAYAELDRRANRLARHLRARGVRPGVLTPICVERSLEMLVGLLGILKAGGTCVPLDPASPPERLARVLEDCRAPLLVTEGALLRRLPPAAGRRVCLDLDVATIGAAAADAFDGGSRPGDLACLIYPEPPTGELRGVEIQHRAAVNLLESMAREPGLHSRDTWLAVSPVSSDMALLELFGPLAVGARLVVLGREPRDGRALARALSDSGATVMQATPAIWRRLLESGWLGDRRLKLLCGGPGLTPELAQQLRDCGASLWNLYGAPEATVWAAASRVEAGEGPGADLALAGPIANLELHVLDARRQALPVGVPGELYIGGVGLARGYHRRPDLDAERFVEHPFAPEPGARLFRTGDRVRRLPDGGVALLADPDPSR